MTTTAISKWAVLLLALATSSWAHVGVVNTQLPWAVAGKSYELVLAVPHGCEYSTPSGTTAHADTYKVEVTIPAGFTGVRPIIDGVFGRPAIVRDAEGNATMLTFTRTGPIDAAADEVSYRVGLRGTAPNAPLTTLQFNTRQFCRNPAGGDDLVVDWANYGSPATNQSPKVKVFPPRVPGWNKLSLAANNEKHSPDAIKALLNDFFADAEIVWLMPGSNDGKGAWSSNPETAARIRAQALSDSSVYELVSRTEVMIHATDVLWVKF